MRIDTLLHVYTKLLHIHTYMRVYRSKFTYEDYKVNKRCFSRFMLKDEVVMKRATVFQKLPETLVVTHETVAKKRKKKTGYSSLSENSPVKAKRRCKIGDDTTEEED